MSQPDDGARDIGSPFRVFNPHDLSSMFDVDFAPQPVSVRDIHPTEIEPDPKDEESSSVQESAEGSSTREMSTQPATPENPVSAEKVSSVPGLEDLLDSSPPTPTSLGSEMPPVSVPPLPPAKTPSSRSAGKSA